MIDTTTDPFSYLDMKLLQLIEARFRSDLFLVGNDQGVVPLTFRPEVFRFENHSHSVGDVRFKSD